jgi:RNA polymerase sigma-70 factor (ECF subfamily)
MADMIRTAEAADHGKISREPPRWLIALYQDHSASLCRFLRRKYGAGPPEPEDIVHEAFSRLATLSPFLVAQIEFPKAFLYRTAENLLNTERRKRAIRAAHAMDARFLEPVGSDCTPERILLAKADLDLVEALLRAMPEKRRLCFLMHRFEELSFVDIGRRMGMTPNGAKKHVLRAMADIAAALDQAEQTEA